jgi:hypothetical protein
VEPAERTWTLERSPSTASPPVALLCDRLADGRRQLTYSDPMTARDDVVRAARALTRRGEAPFSPADVIAEVRAQGSTYPDRTLRTHVISVMCTNSPDHHGAAFHDLRRVGRGQYVLNEAATTTHQPESVESTVEPPPSSAQVSALDEDEWEGNVQERVAEVLRSEGWTIERMADTASGQQGTDIVASRDQERVHVEVKGWPSELYVRGARAGERKSTRPASQARQWFSHALLKGMLLRSAYPDDRVALAFPDRPTYRSLHSGVSHAAELAGIEIWLVTPTEPGRPDGDQRRP